LDQDFESISMTAFVRDGEAREHLEAATARWGEGDADKAAERLRLAFDRLIRDYEERKVRYPGRSLFRTEPPFRPSELDDMHNKVGKSLTDWLSALDQRQKLVAFGVDLREYAFFDAHTPNAQYALTAEGPPRAIFIRGANEVTLIEETFRRCHRFVLEAALVLGAEDYDFDGYSGRHSTAPSV
jgi:hypothetical protein